MFKMIKEFLASEKKRKQWEKEFEEEFDRAYKSFMREEKLNVYDK